MTDIAVLGLDLDTLAFLLNATQFKDKNITIFIGENTVTEAEFIDHQREYYPDNMDLVANLSKNMLDEVRLMPNVSFVDGRLMSISEFDGQFMITMSDGIYECNCVVFAYDLPPKYTVDGEAEFLGHGLGYHPTTEGLRYVNKNIIIYGLDKEAVQDANFLSGKGVNVTLVSPFSWVNSAVGSVKKVTGTIKAVKGERSKLRYVEVDGELIKTDALFIDRSFTPPKFLIKNLEVGTDGYVIVNDDYTTNISGVFAFGASINARNNVKESIKNTVDVAQSIKKFLSRE